jgi:hypothetical protein
MRGCMRTEMIVLHICAELGNGVCWNGPFDRVFDRPETTCVQRTIYVHIPVSTESRVPVEGKSGGGVGPRPPIAY